MAASVGLAAFPFLAPLLEVYFFSRGSAEKIEDTVKIRQSLQVSSQSLPGRGCEFSFCKQNGALRAHEGNDLGLNVVLQVASRRLIPAFLMNGRFPQEERAQRAWFVDCRKEGQKCSGFPEKTQSSVGPMRRRPS